MTSHTFRDSLDIHLSRKCWKRPLRIAAFALSLRFYGHRQIFILLLFDMYGGNWTHKLRIDLEVIRSVSVFVPLRPETAGVNHSVWHP